MEEQVSVLLGYALKPNVGFHYRLAMKVFVLFAYPKGQGDRYCRPTSRVAY